MKKLILVLVALAALFTMTTAAYAYKVERFNSGDKVITGGFGGRLGGKWQPHQFVFAGDFEYYLGKQIALIFPFTLIGFGEASSISTGVGAGAKYRFHTKSAFSPYLKAALTMYYTRYSVANFGFNTFSMYFQFGGGCDYFFSKRFGVGLELGFKPGFGTTGSVNGFGGGTGFAFAVDLLVKAIFRL